MRIKSEDEVTEYAIDKGKEYSSQAVKQILNGYQIHKKGIVAATIGSILTATATPFFIISGLLARSLPTVGVGVVLGLLTFFLLAAAVGGLVWLYHRIISMGAGRAIELIRDVLIFTFGLSEDSRVIRWVMKFGARFIWNDLNN